MKSVVTDFEALPVELVAETFSFTTPRDVCALSLVSKTFCSAAEFDVVWDSFLPSDLESIISDLFLPDAASSKKDLFLALSRQPIIVDEGRKSFQLDKWSGKKCYMLAARDLVSVRDGNPRYWTLTSLPESRFEEVAVLVKVWWFEIRGKISTTMLSSNTQYAAYLVFKLTDGHGFHNCPVQLSMKIPGNAPNTRIARLVPDIEEEDDLMNDEEWLRLQSPTRRSDGWWEIEMAEFFNSEFRDEQLEMSLLQIDCSRQKSGLILQGIELRPKLL